MIIFVKIKKSLWKITRSNWVFVGFYSFPLIPLHIVQKNLWNLKYKEPTTTEAPVMPYVTMCSFSHGAEKKKCLSFPKSFIVIACYLFLKVQLGNIFLKSCFYGWNYFYINSLIRNNKKDYVIFITGFYGCSVIPEIINVWKLLGEKKI